MINIYKKLTNWKYRHFVNKLRGVERMTEDLIFKRFKTLEIRDQIRQECDNNKARLDSIEQQIKNQKENPTLEEGEIKRLDDTKVILEREIERLTQQMRGLDLDVSGSKPTNEFPDGLEGINHQIDALYELKQMIKAYLKQI